MENEVKSRLSVNKRWIKAKKVIVKCTCPHSPDCDMPECYHYTEHEYCEACNYECDKIGDCNRLCTEKEFINE